MHQKTVLGKVTVRQSLGDFDQKVRNYLGNQRNGLPRNGTES